jgi:hypothetical protein
MLDTALAAPHLATWSGPQPPAAIPSLLRDILANPDSAHIMPRFRRFLSRDLNDWYRGLVAPARQWTFAGCDSVARTGIAYLGTRVAYICHARSARASGGGTVVSVLYSADWRAAGVKDTRTGLYAAHARCPASRSACHWSGRRHCRREIGGA